MSATASEIAAAVAGGTMTARQVVEAGAERLEDPAHVRILKREADLDPEEAERDVPQRRERLVRFLGDCSCVHSFPSRALTR